MTTGDVVSEPLFVSGTGIGSSFGFDNHSSVEALASR